MVFIEYKELIESLNKHEYLIGVHDDTMVFAFYRNQYGKMKLYDNIYYSYDVDEEAYKTWMTENHGTIENEDIAVFKGNYSVFMMWARRRVCKMAEKPTENTLEVVKHYNELKANGKVCQFSENNFGIVVGVLMSDEDLYWAYINENKELKLSSCVGNVTETDENADKYMISDVEVAKQIHYHLFTTYDVFITDFTLNNDNKEFYISNDMLRPI